MAMGVTLAPLGEYDGSCMAAIRPYVTFITCLYYFAPLSGARCRLACGPADATATHRLCFSKIQIGFTFLVPAHSGSPGQIAVKRVCVLYYLFLKLSLHCHELTGRH